MPDIRPQDIAPDPLLTGFTVQYGKGGPFAADEIAPVVPVANSEYKFPTYRPSALSLHVQTEVAPGAAPNVFRSVKPVFTGGATTRHALDDFLTDEVKLAPVVGPLSRESSLAQTITHNLRLGIETRVKGLLDTMGGSVSPTVKWDGTNPKIEKDIDGAKKAVLLACGAPATHIVIPPDVAIAAKQDPAIRDLRRYTDPTLLVNGDLPPTLWGLKVVIPGALQNTAGAGQTQSIGQVWADDTVYLLHVNGSIAGNGEALTALAQMRWYAWGSTFAAYTWRDSHLSKKVTWVSVEVHQGEQAICPDAVYRLTDVLA